jgi:hypothetical protein
VRERERERESSSSSSSSSSNKKKKAEVVGGVCACDGTGGDDLRKVSIYVSVSMYQRQHVSCLGS